MKKTGFIAFLLALCLTCFSQTPSPDAILGTWLTASGKAKVKIYKEGTNYFGKIVWLKNPHYDDGTPKVDKNNPDKTKQKTPLMGLNMLKNFSFDEDEWNDGTIYDPENGKTYSCKIKIRDNTKLDVRGYIGFSMIGRTEVWYKVTDVD